VAGGGRGLTAASDLDLARLRVRVLFDLDARGRMAAVRDFEGRPPPRLHLTRTAAGTVALPRHDLGSDLVQALEAEAAAEPAGGDLAAPPARLEAYRRLLAPVRRETSGPCYLLPADVPWPEGVVRIEPSNASLLRQHYRWALERPQDYSPLVAAVEDGAAVALAHSSRRPPPGAECGVETVEAYRRRGHGARVAAGWAHLLGGAGITPFYSTSWDNEASRRIAESLRGRFFASDLAIW
jgi:hypothetical protein